MKTFWRVFLVAAGIMVALGAFAAPFILNAFTGNPLWLLLCIVTVPTYIATIWTLVGEKK